MKIKDRFGDFELFDGAGEVLDVSAVRTVSLVVITGLQLLGSV